MKPSHALASSLLCFALAACGQHDASRLSAQKAADASHPAAKQPARKPARLTAEDIARIEATGKTGLWTNDATEICSKRRRGTRATLVWNAKGQADKVVLTLSTSAGKQRDYAKGGAVGQRTTGPWVRPGMTFKLLKAGDRSELGTVSFTQGPNCR